MSSFCLCYIALTGSVSGSVEVMNLIMIDISPILLFFARIVYLFCSKKCSFLFGTYFAQNSASKIYQCLVMGLVSGVVDSAVADPSVFNSAVVDSGVVDSGVVDS